MGEPQKGWIPTESNHKKAGRELRRLIAMREQWQTHPDKQGGNGSHQLNGGENGGRADNWL
jgi:hypothetical protein